MNLRRHPLFKGRDAGGRTAVRGNRKGGGKVFEKIQAGPPGRPIFPSGFPPISLPKGYSRRR
nr:hypothetical protein [Bacillaceae bacterium]